MWSNVCSWHSRTGSGEQLHVTRAGKPQLECRQIKVFSICFITNTKSVSEDSVNDSIHSCDNPIYFDFYSRDSR